jgi:hypothetical protein
VTTPTPVPPSIVDEAALRRSVRTLITVADNVRRGAIPPRVLDRMVAPQVAHPIVAELPASSGVSSGVSEVHTVLLQQPDPLTTYFTGTAQRPDGTAVAYLGTIARTSERDRWQITQVLPVTERTIGLGSPHLEDIAADPHTTQQFRDLVSGGYLDPAVQLLGPIPFDDAGQRHDWLDAATAIRNHGQTHQLGYTVTSDLQTTTDPTATPTPTWAEARQFIDAYLSAYDVDIARYADFATRLEALDGHEPDQQVGVDLEAGLDLEAGR